ncbi:MAG: phosphatase PAP2 family protein [Terriglobales bacterium]
MAWETWKSCSPERRLLWIVCSALWSAFLLLAAYSLDLSVPYLPLAVAGALVFYLRNWPKTADFVAWVVLSAGFALVIRFPSDHNSINSGSGILAGFGLGAFLMLGLRWLWSESAERRKTYAVLAPAAALVCFVLSAQRALSLANLLYPKTFDLYLYLFDGSLGFQPSFVAGKAMAASAVLRVAASLTYVSLPFVMALVYALHQPKDAERPSWDIVTLFLLGGLGGWALYNIVPATGPAYVFGMDFPWRSLPYHSLHKLFLEKIPVNGDIPRNAIPSLHLAWVLLLYWNTKSLSRFLRVFMAIYLALTIVSTLGTGEHYFVDLVAGVPFAFFVQSVVSPETKPEASKRAIVAGAGLALTLSWLLLVRFGARWMLVSPALPWGLVAVTGVAVWKLRLWFEAPILTSADQPEALPANMLSARAGK